MRIQMDWHQSRTVVFVLFIFLLFSRAPGTLAAPASMSIETYHWPPGVFLSFGKLKQAQKERLLSEVETKLAGLRQGGKNLLVKGELLVKVQAEVAEFNPATVLDQSGMVVMVNHFPNIYYKLDAPESLLRRNTAFVLKNPQVDRVESTLRQAVVLRGEFVGFSQTYIKATTESLEKALASPPPTGPAPSPSRQTEKLGKKR